MFSVVLNVNLALLNLLPFPVLDGGHITLALFERSDDARSALSLRMLANGVRGGLDWVHALHSFFDTGDCAARDVTTKNRWSLRRSRRSGALRLACEGTPDSSGKAREVADNAIA